MASFLNETQWAVRQKTKNLTGEEKWNKLHIVGHSLGAHVSGMLGNILRWYESVNLAVERITGLDPAGPCFKETLEDFRLDRSNADFVDVIHTQHSNTFSLGSKELLGRKMIDK